MRQTTFAVAVALSAILAACQNSPTQTKQSSAPLPDNIKISKSSGDIPEEKAEYIGKWQGRWGGTLDSYLVVKNVSEDRADVIYAWGTNQYVNQAGWEPHTGYFRGGELVVPLDRNPTVEARYQLTEKGNLDASYRNERNDSTAEATFVKVGSN